MLPSENPQEQRRRFRLKNMAPRGSRSTRIRTATAAHHICQKRRERRSCRTRTDPRRSQYAAKSFASWSPCSERTANQGRASQFMFLKAVRHSTTGRTNRCASGAQPAPNRRKKMWKTLSVDCCAGRSQPSLGLHVQKCGKPDRHVSALGRHLEQQPRGLQKA